MLRTEVFEPAEVEWATLLMFATKKDESLRFCVYHRKLFAFPVLNSYFIPRMDDCIDLLSNAAVFSLFNANRSYCQVDIDDTARD